MLGFYINSEYVMDRHHLIAKLESAAKKALYFADQERDKTKNGAYSPFIVPHARSLMRENFFRERQCAILAIIEKVRTLQEESLEDQEEIVYIARRFIAEIKYPWIRRRTLAEDLYSEIYKDSSFEPYTKDMVYKRDIILHSGIDVLGLGNELEKELYEILLKTISGTSRRKHYPVVGDIVEVSDKLSHFFKDDWTRKANLIRFRLYEIGALS